MSNTSSSEISSSNTCANCGKEGSDVTNTCNKCKTVMYCNAACKKKNRHKHKKQCERRVAELHDEKLFKQPPPLEDCPICMIRLPVLDRGIFYMECCSKRICSGCIHAPLYDNKGNEVDNKKCPFCRTPPPSSYDEAIKRYKQRVEMNNPKAMQELGFFYASGLFGLQQNSAKGLELWHKAGELGSAEAYYNIGISYDIGEGIDVDKNKAIHYWELAAMGGYVRARLFLGIVEEKEGNMDRALRHYMIAVKDGDSDSLKKVKSMYIDGHATKDDYAEAVRAYQEFLDEIKSEQRDEAAAADGGKYYDSAE